MPSGYREVEVERLRAERDQWVARTVKAEDELKEAEATVERLRDILTARDATEVSDA